MSSTSAFFNGKYVTVYGSEYKTGVVVYPKISETIYYLCDCFYAI